MWRIAYLRKGIFLKDTMINYSYILYDHGILDHQPLFSPGSEVPNIFFTAGNDAPVFPGICDWGACPDHGRVRVSCDVSLKSFFLLSFVSGCSAKPPNSRKPKGLFSPAPKNRPGPFTSTGLRLPCPSASPLVLFASSKCHDTHN